MPNPNLIKPKQIDSSLFDLVRQIESGDIGQTLFAYSNTGYHGPNVLYITGGTQIIQGQKTFTISPSIPYSGNDNQPVSKLYISDQVNTLQSNINSLNANLLHTTGNESALGIKTFDSVIINQGITGASINFGSGRFTNSILVPTIGLNPNSESAINLDYFYNQGIIFTTGDQTIVDTKTFLTTPILSNQAVNQNEPARFDQLVSSGNKLQIQINALAKASGSKISGFGGVISFNGESGNIIALGRGNVTVAQQGDITFISGAMPVLSGSGVYLMQGEQGLMGPYFHLRGAWTTGITYSYLDVATLSGSAYTATTGHLSTASNMPGTGGTLSIAPWIFLVSGVQGQTGPTGAWNFKGPFNTGLTYTNNNAVTYVGSTYGFNGTGSIGLLAPTGLGWYIVAQSGSIGPIGISGYSGFSGYSGYSGSGRSGYSGYSGVRGFSGFSGDPAQQSGYSGYSGSGVSGYSGFCGKSGFSGYSGRSGYSGFSGDPAQQSGYSGYSGDSGLSGYSGYSGYSGISGFSGLVGLAYYAEIYTVDGSLISSVTNTYVPIDQLTNNGIAFGMFPNAALSKLTIGNDGFYEIDLSMSIGFDTQANYTVGIFLNGSVLDDAQAQTFCIANITAAQTFSISSIAQLTDGDDLVVQIKNADGGSGNYTLFQGNFSIRTLGAQGRGLSGYSGRSGRSGYSGISGSLGISGYSGFSGDPAQESGYSGYSGASGYSGYSSTSGYSGYSGYSGANPGASGYSGYSGDSGYSGYSGANPGASGYSGYSGKSGYSGYSSASGYSGYSGANPGASGYSGYCGSSGYSGYSGLVGPIGSFVNSGTITGNFTNLSFYLDFPSTGLYLSEAWVSQGFTFSGYAIGCTTSGAGPLHLSSGFSGLTLFRQMTGSIYQRDANNTVQEITPFSFDSGIFTKISGNFAVPVSGLNRVGLSIYSGLSGLRGLSFMIAGF